MAALHKLRIVLCIRKDRAQFSLGSLQNKGHSHAAADAKGSQTHFQIIFFHLPCFETAQKYIFEFEIKIAGYNFTDVPFLNYCKIKLHKTCR